MGRVGKETYYFTWGLKLDFDIASENTVNVAPQILSDQNQSLNIYVCLSTDSDKGNVAKQKVCRCSLESFFNFSEVEMFSE